MAWSVASIDSTDASTGASLVAASTGLKAQIYRIYMSSDLATKLTLSCGAAENQRHDFFCAANGGQDIVSAAGRAGGDQAQEYLYLGDANTAVTLTAASTGANVAATVWYDLV